MAVTEGGTKRVVNTHQLSIQMDHDRSEIDVFYIDCLKGRAIDEHGVEITGCVEFYQFK